MSTLDISKAVASDMTNAFTETEIASKSTDGISDQTETQYVNTEATKFWGYFNEHPELKTAILMRGIWDCGKGWEADPRTTIILERIRGMGKDTFDEILFNLDVCRYIYRDSFAEIIKDEDTGILINLKPLDPSSIRIIIDGKGIIKRYEQISKTGDKTSVIKFKPEQIFHLTNNRLADQIHGISVIESLDKTILAEVESFVDMKKIMHQQARPFMIYKWKTDDEVKINEMKSRIDKLRNLGEDLHLPDDNDVLTIQEVKINVSDIVLVWRNDITNKFYRALGMPLVLFGAQGSTESGGKMEIFAHENVWEYGQRYLEKQVWNQLYLKINLISPVSMAQNLMTDEQKDASASGMQQGLDMGQKGDMTAGVGE